MTVQQSIGLWRNYLVSAWRALSRHRSYAALNLAGLALGLAAFLLILTYVRYELGYDRWLADADRTFQLQQWIVGGDEDVERGGQQMTSYVSGARLRDFPEVERVVYAGRGQPVILQDGEGTLSEDFVYVDGPLFQVLGVPFLRGDPRTALTAPGSMVLTSAEALRRFGTLDVVGRTLTLVAGARSTDYRIEGVITDPPRDSHLALSVVARVDPNVLWAGQEDFLTQWMPKNGWVYARLRPGARVDDVMRQMPAWERRNIPDQLIGGERVNVGENVDWRLVNVRDIHLGEAGGGKMRPGNDRATIAAMALVGLLILAMAVVNFINLATARAGQRAREVALRKVMGASRRQLVAQFLGESFLLVAAAMAIGLALAELALPKVNAFLDADMALRWGGIEGLLAPVAGLIAIVGLAGGLYPALYLSRFQPARVLKANRSAAEAEGSGRLRGILVVAQFAVSIGLIICTVVIQAQAEHARTTDPGYRRDGLIQIANVNRRALATVRDALIREIGGIEGVTAVGRSTIGVATFGMENIVVTRAGASQGVELEHYRVDPGFFPTIGIAPRAGRTFRADQALDDRTIDLTVQDSAAAEAALARRGYNIVINARAVQALGFPNPAAAVGQTLLADDRDVESIGRTPVTIVGVVGDSRFRSIREDIEPMLFSYDRVRPGWLLVRYSGQPRQIRARIERAWKRIAPDVPFEADFADDVVRNLYAPEAARAQLFAAFALLAIVIGCLGLFGLAAFTAERRTKEIGIRKVLGARTRDIVRLLVWQFSRPVIIANLIAWPIAWWLMRDWLNGFDDRITLDPVYFAGAGALALVIAAATVASHALRVARTHPIHALRYE